MKKTLFAAANRTFYDDGSYTSHAWSRDDTYSWRVRDGEVQFRGCDVKHWTPFTTSQASVQEAYSKYLAKLIVE